MMILFSDWKEVKCEEENMIHQRQQFSPVEVVLMLQD